MPDSSHEKDLIRLATRNVEQLQGVAAAVEAKLGHDPEGAKELHRPCSVLLQRLLAAQGSIEALLQKLYTAEMVGTGTGRR
jgi:3-oxoacyl-[acyl-carrier-protein] synthase III